MAASRLLRAPQATGLGVPLTPPICLLEEGRMFKSDWVHPWKFTNEKFISRAQEVHGDKYDYSLVEYVNGQTQVKIVCRQHGLFEQRPMVHIHSKSGCPKCSCNFRTYKYKISELEALCPDMVKGQIHGGANAKAQYRFLCPIHGEYTRTLKQRLVQKLGCRKCAGNERLTIDEAERRAPTMVKGQTWINNHSKYWFECPKHGRFKTSFKTHVKALKTGLNGCLKCQHESIGERNRRSVEEIARLFPDFIPGQTSLPGAYSKYRFLCPVHGEYRRSVNSRLSQGGGCQKCGRARIAEAIRDRVGWTIEEMEIECPDLVRGQRYEGISSSVKYIFTCDKHGNYLQRFSDHRRGVGCPKCCMSRSERKIAEWLSSRLQGETFESQKRFETCRYKKKLSFDFGSDVLKVLLEYNGRQHYHASKFRWYQITAKQVKVNQARDCVKRNWARRNGYKLIVVPYTIKNIASYLEKRLSGILPPKRSHLAAAA